MLTVYGFMRQIISKRTMYNIIKRDENGITAKRITLENGQLAKKINKIFKKRIYLLRIDLSSVKKPGSFSCSKIRSKLTIRYYYSYSYNDHTFIPIVIIVVLDDPITYHQSAHY
jgi:hypothetical protein